MSGARAAVPAPVRASAPRAVATRHKAEPAGAAAVRGTLPAQWSFASVTVSSPAEAVAGPGRPLDSSTRRSMESRFGHDLSGVRVHDDARAAEAATGIDAAAFTVGQDIVFGPGRYSLGSGSGRELLAHELAHTIQQRGADRNGPPVEPGAALEATAERAGARAAAGIDVTESLGTSLLAVARTPSQRSLLERYGDDYLVQQAGRLTMKLFRRPAYPGRDEDRQLLDDLYAEIARRRALAEKPPEPDKAPAETHDTDADEPVAPVPMALPHRGRAGAKPAAASAPAKAPHATQHAPGRFEPGGFTDDDVYGPVREDELRIKLQSVPNPVPFEERWYAARTAAAARESAGVTLSPEAVWEAGRGEGLFTEDDRWAFDGLWKERIGEPAQKESARKRRVAEGEREQAWEAKGASFSDPSMFVQPFAFGGLGKLAALGYAAYSGAQTGVHLGHGIRSGDPGEIAGAVVDVGVTLATHSAMGGGGSPARPRNVYPEFDAVRPAMQPTVDAEVQELSGQLGIPLRSDRVLDAPWIGRIKGPDGKPSSASTSAGYLRNESRFWSEYRRRFPTDYALVGKGETVTPALAHLYGWPSSVVGQKLVHHHIGNGQFVVAIPQSLHKSLSGDIHAQATDEGTP